MAGSDNSKAFAVLLAFLMATISFSASISSWEFSTLDEKSTVENVSSNSTVEIVNNIPSIIETGILGNINSGTYEQINSDSGMHFLAENISDENKLASGNQHICAITNEVSVLCWGDNTHNQLGVSDSSLRRNIVDLGVGRTAIAVAAGISHTCAILDNGSLKCWGSTAAGQTNGILNGDTTPRLVDLGIGRTAVSVSLGGAHTCTILDDGSLKCWGSNNYGQLGLGSTSAYSSPQSVFLGVGRTAVSVSLGWYHTCAILDDGSLKCWGQNSQGQLGIGTTLDSSIPQLVNLGTTPLSVSLGMWHTCATTNNNVMCWGNNNKGQLGTNSQTASSTPQVVNFVAVSLSLGRVHTCGISSVGIVKCWGSNDHGQIGFIGGDPNQIENYYDSPKTAYFSEDNIAIKISAGNDFNCAVSQNNTIRCWGLNNAGQLGFLSYGYTKSHYPELFGDKINVKAKHISAKNRANCVISDFSELYCWGNNPLGLLGLNSFGFQNIRKPTKANMPNDLGVIDIGLAEDHVCALLEDSNVYCWGNSDYGQIPGSGGYTIFPTMVNLGSGVNSETIAAAGRYSCSLMDNGEIKCWGDNVNGQLGIGSVGGEHLPTTVNLGSNAEFISTSSGHACAILTNGGVKCWGSNSAGQLGAGTSGGRTGNPTLVNLPSGRYAESIFLGSSSSCAILDNGSLYCWGANSFGQLGIGSTTSHNTPQYVDFGNNVAVQSVAISTYHACAILVNGSTYCWGSNTEGQLGLGNTLSFQTPQYVDLEIDEKAVSIGIGFQHTCVVLESGLMKCWGNGAEGALGTGSFTSYNLPQETIGIEYTHPIKAVPNINNSWVGSVKSDGNYNLQVWYNSSSSSIYHNTILSVIPQLEYQSNNFSFTVNQTLQNISPVSVNGNNYFFTISPNLPTGLLFNQSTAVISGTPSEVIPEIQYIIRGFNQDGIGETKLSIEITDIIPDFSIDNNNLNFIRGFKDETFNVNNLGGAITISSLEPQISGLSSMNSLFSNSLIFNEASNCAILSSNLTCWNTDLISQSPNSFLTVNHEHLITDLSISSTNICAINSENQAICLGENGFGQIDSSLTSYSNLTDLDIDQVYAEKQIAVISNQICVLNLLGEINCQGLVNSSKVGGNLGPFYNLDSGRSHFCALNYIGKLYCWGDNTDSAIASGQSTSSGFQTELNPIILGVGVTVSSFDTGQKHNCVIRNDGKIMCWGTGTNGQLGNGYSVTDSTPSLVASPAWATYTKVSAGNSHTCAMLDDNGVMCWGDNSKGQLGDGTTTNRLIPVNVSIIPSWMNVVDVVAGDSGTCVIDDLAAVWCWGDNSNQKLGLNSTINTATTPQPIRFSDSASLMGVLPMGVLTGAPLTSQPATVHRLYGNNSGGSDDVNITITVGLAADYPISHLNLTRNTSVVNVSPVLTGGPYQFSIHPSLPPGMNLGINNGTIWGTPLDDQVSTIHTITVENNSGWDKVEINITVADILANISYPSSDYTFVRNWTIDSLDLSNIGGGDLLSVNSNINLPIGLELNTSLNRYDSAIASESGGYHSCSILDDGSLKCWGYNNHGQLGIGTSGGFTAPPVTTPQLVDLGVGRTAVSLGLGLYHTCAILDDGSLKCWGYNNYGQLGIGSNTNQNTPQLVDLGVGRTAVSVSLGLSHTCAILDDGSLKCWGYNNYGQLGIGSITNQDTPQLVDLGVGRTAVSVSLGWYHTCAILDDGSLKCWGYNNHGQLGIGTSGSSTNQLTPQLVDLGVGRTAVSVSLGLSHTCAILDDGSLKCWGYNNYGQLGNGGYTSTQNTPQLVDLGVGRTAVSVSLGQYHTCAILDDGNLKCWGWNNQGQLGNGGYISTQNYIPQLVDLGVGRTAVSVSLGQSHTCAILDDGSLKCWGYNIYGQIGIGASGSSTNQLTPQLVDLGVGRTAVSVSLGNSHTCAILDDGSLKCWGWNINGRLGIGNGSTTLQTTPQLVDLGVGRTAVSVSIGGYHTCAILDDGNLKCWGLNSFGQLGIGSIIDQTTPAFVEGFGQSIKLGKIYGTPIQTTPTQTYTFYGNNSVGFDTFDMDITVVPAYDYGNNTLVLTRNESMTARSPIITGGPYTVAISPPLPQGLNFEPSNGTIWGTPPVNQTTQTYFITVSNSSGSDIIELTITIDDIAPFVTYDTYNETFVRGFNITTIEANQTGGNVHSVQVNPALPQGIEFSNDANQVGFISGIPLIKSEWTDYTIWTNNSVGSHSSIISMRVVPAYDYGNNTLNLVRNETMSTRSPIITGGPYTTVSIQPSLPVGLFFEPTNGSIWGTPIFDQAGTDYTITVSNQYGSDSSIISIAISEIPPILEYDVSYMSYRRGFLSEHPVANLTGGAVAGFEISPSLPAGLHFNISSGIISGIPTTTHSLTTHTIWANNSFGSSSWDINFEVLPGIDNSYNSIYLTRNVTMPAYSPTINIDQITLSIQPPLPDGLSFDYQTAVITGTPLIPWSNTFYSIRLSNSTGEDWLNFTLEVEEILPNIYYPSSNLNLFNGYGFEPLRPIGDAGYPENWAWNGSSVVGIHLSKYNSTDTISSSGSTICTITADYRVVCWGANGMGQLGQGNTNSISNLVNVTLTSIHSPVDIAVGKYHTCVVNSAGEIECWGQNDFGQLGRGFSCAYGSYSNGCNGNFAVSSPGKVSYSGEFGFVEVSVGDTHTCGILANGTAMCWGSNSDGQLGEGSNTDSLLPVYVSSAQSIYFTQIDLGKAHSCATNYSGEIYCWGRNSFGQLGDGTIQNRLIPTLVNLPIGYSAISVSSGGDHSCAILNGSQPACWGRNSQGQLGDGTLLGKLEPRIIVNSAWTGTSRIIIGEGQSCVVTLDDEVWCWGQSSAGMFSSTNSILTSPVKVENTNSIGASLVVVGENHLCISTIRWSVMCSGDNQENQIPWNNASMVSELNEYRGLMIHVDRSIAGTIYGAPENGLGSITLEMAITNDIGTQYVQNTIIIFDSFSYPLSFIESIRNQSLSPVTPSLSGLTNARFTIEPNLPAGLNINSLTGEISGMPTVNSTENTYVITYASVYGEVSTSISLVIYEPAADIVYPVSDIIITRAGQFIQYAPTVSNGFVSHWSISPSLPLGLSFNNGLISGQALNNQTNTTYRVYGNNSGGVSFVDLTITILEPIPEFTPLQTEYVIQRGDILADIIVGNTGGNVALWTISPQLPNGLVFTNGRISGIPIENISSITYTIRGENTGGFDEVSFTIQVLEPAPVIQGQYSSITAIRDNQIDEIIISNSGGMAENWTIIPELPEGLIFENGYIYGTPSVNSTSELFTITAVSEGGSSQWSFNLEVLEPSPEFSLSGFDYILYKDEPFEAIKTTSSGGNIASYSITPTLPSGMFFDENRGIIQGVPLIISPEIQYTITAQNSGGTYQQTISIIILNQAPIFTLPYESISLTEQVEMAKFSPFISSNIVVDTWSLEFEQGNQLPQGLVFDSTSGSIFGKPTSVVPEINITINASNDGGFYSLSFKVKVLSDYDGDTIPDELDEDDDNDGYSDKEEELKDSDPYDEDSNPVEGFEIIIPNTEISLGAWDIIGMLTGIPLIIFLTFSLLTRNKRMKRFQDSLEMAKSREEISEIAERYEKALMLRLIGPHHGMRLERIRAETDDKLEEAERRFRYKMEEQQQQFKEKVEVEKAQFFDEVDQTPLVEQSEELAVEQSEEAGLGPQIDTEPTQTDEQGRQWYYDEEQRYWWRDSSEEEWQLLDNDSTESKNREEELKQNKF